jgi:hypothetical protein
VEVDVDVEICQGKPGLHLPPSRRGVLRARLASPIPNPTILPLSHSRLVLPRPRSLFWPGRGPARFTAHARPPLIGWPLAARVERGEPKCRDRDNTPLSLVQPPLFPAASTLALASLRPAPTCAEYPHSHPQPFVEWPAQHIRQNL